MNTVAFAGASLLHLMQENNLAAMLRRMQVQVFDIGDLLRQLGQLKIMGGKQGTCLQCCQILGTGGSNGQAIMRAGTLFSTHYFELTDLPQQITNIKNLHLHTAEHGGKIVFLHQVQQGRASKSYGIHVAELAGVPQPVINLAKQHLAALAQATPASAYIAPYIAPPQPLPTVASNTRDAQANPEQTIREQAEQYRQIQQKIANLDLDTLSPRAAWEQLDQLQQLVQQSV